MAQVTFKHGTVQKSRHIVRNLVSASLAMIRTLNNETEKGAAALQGAVADLHVAQSRLAGMSGLSQEQQVEMLGSARERLTSALKQVSVADKAHKDKTSHQTNMYGSILSTIEEAKAHVTSGRQFAKDRRFVPKGAQPEPEGEVADVVSLIEEKDHGLG